MLELTHGQRDKWHTVSHMQILCSNCYTCIYVGISLDICLETIKEPLTGDKRCVRRCEWIQESRDTKHM